MSKPISFGFGKQKPPNSFPGTSLPARRPGGALLPSSKTTLRNDSDNEDEEEPRHESVTGFSSSGAILSKAVQETTDRIIENPGNADWRKRGRKNLLPEEVQTAQRQNGDVVTVERQEVSTSSGLQYAETKVESSNGNDHRANVDARQQEQVPVKKLTADEEALHALLDDGTVKPKSTAIIDQRGNALLTQRDETQDFREDVASRPDSSTLDEYAAMPVEEFGLAMLRGMGKKRRANGEVIDLTPKPEEKAVKVRKQEGFLGIGAKAAPGTISEIGAWGKADMRKNNKGEGFFTPLMRENKATGERITEEEFQKRIKESKGEKTEEDWRQRRDRNLENNARDRDREAEKTNGDRSYRDEMNSFSRSSSRRDRSDRDQDSSRSRKDRSRSKERRRRDDDHEDRDGRHRDRHRDRYRDEERYDSSSSRRSHQDGVRDRGTDRDRDRDRDRNRDSERDRDHDRRHRDRR